MRKRLFFLTPLAMGILLITFVSTKPRFENYQGSDVVTLVAAGALLAVALAGLFGKIQRPGQ